MSITEKAGKEKVVNGYSEETISSGKSFECSTSTFTIDTRRRVAPGIGNGMFMTRFIRTSIFLQNGVGKQCKQ